MVHLPPALYSYGLNPYYICTMYHDDILQTYGLTANKICLRLFDRPQYFIDIQLNAIFLHNKMES